MRLALALVVIGACERPDPRTFPKMIGGANCHAMLGNLFGCTYDDGHHTLYFGVNEPPLVGGPKVLTDCGGTWHEITVDQAAEMRCIYMELEPAPTPKLGR